MRRLARLFVGGSAGNESLTAAVATVLVVLLAAEGATLLRINALLTVHAFIGMLLIPVVLLKLASTGWRMVRYYAGGAEYIVRGPPHLVLRMIVAPVLVATTIILFGTGVVLLAREETNGAVVGLHKASFIVWVGAMAIHVLTRSGRLWTAVRTHGPGFGLRVALLVASVGAGAVLATVTLPAVDHLQDHATQHFGFDDH